MPWPRASSRRSRQSWFPAGSGEAARRSAAGDDRAGLEASGGAHPARRRRGHPRGDRPRARPSAHSQRGGAARRGRAARGV